MIADEQGLIRTIGRMAWFRGCVMKLRETEKNRANYDASASSFLAEIDRMELEVREYLRKVPSDEMKAV